MVNVEKATAAGFRFRDRLPLSEVEAFEARAGISLPRDYVEFLTLAGNGTTPPHQILPLEAWNGHYWIAEPRLESALRTPCIVTPAAADAGAGWIDAQGVVNWSRRLDADEWDPMFGTIALAEIGCGLYYSLIVNGPHAGRVFVYGDSVENPPVFAYAASFGEWFETQVASLAGGLRVDFH